MRKSSSVHHAGAAMLAVPKLLVVNHHVHFMSIAHKDACIGAGRCSTTVLQNVAAEKYSIDPYATKSVNPLHEEFMTITSALRFSVVRASCVCRAVQLP